VCPRLQPVHGPHFVGARAVHRSRAAPRPELLDRHHPNIIVGVVLWATLALLTPYLKTLMNYPVLTAGLVLAPRGFGTMLAMVIAGQLLRYIDPRLMIAAGLGITGFALYLMTGFTPDVSQGTLVRTGLIQGFGIGCVFVPLGTVAFGTLPLRSPRSSRLPGVQFDRFGTVASGELGSLHRCQRDFLSRCYPRACPVDFRYRRATQLPGRPV
jgi:MFS family permease